MPSNRFPPFISSQIVYLVQKSRHEIKVERAWSGSKDPLGNLDRFTLLIPYCLDFLRWDIVYNAELPFSPPDVIFGPDDDPFLPFLVSLQNRSSLYYSNYKDHSQLMNLIEELRSKYSEFQRKRIGELDDDRLKFEISTILSREGIEMHMRSVGEKSEEVKFVIPLTEMNINKMMAQFPWKRQQKIHLQVIYPVGKKFASVSSPPRLKLVSSSELAALISVEDIKLPPWLDGMCLAEYLPNLEEFLEKQVTEEVSSIELRRRFIESLVPQFGRPVEADPIFCRKASFLATSGSFTFLIHFLISTQFPKQQPSLILQSTQYVNSQSEPMKSQALSDYPWSPRWELSLMAERIFDFISDESLNFKRQCVDV